MAEELKQEHALDIGCNTTVKSSAAKRKSQLVTPPDVRPDGKKPCCKPSILRPQPQLTSSGHQAVDPPHLQDWISTFQSFRRTDKLEALSALVRSCDASQIQHLKHTINPLLQRDFIALLPKELSLHILTELSPKDLLRSAQVSRSWRTLSEDLVVWREKCEESHVSSEQLPPAPPVPHTHSGGNRAPPFPQLRRRCYFKGLFMRFKRIENNWRANDLPQPMIMRGHDDHVITCLKFCDDLVISGSDDNTLRVWSAASGQCIQTLVGHTGGVWACQVSTEAHSRVIVSGSTDRTVRVWDLDNGQCRHTMVGHTSTVRCVALKDKMVVTGSRDATVRVWNIGTGECVHVLQGHLYAVRCVRFDGRLVISGSYDFTVRVWDVEEANCVRVFEGHTQRVYSLQYDSPRGIVVSGSLDTTVRVWSITGGQCLHTLTGHKSLNSALDLRTNMVISGNADSMVKIWDLATGACLHTLAGHKSAVTGLQLLNNGLVITCSDDGTVKIWSTKTGQYIRDLISLDAGGQGGVIWRLKASQTRLVCAVGSRNGIEDTKLLLLDFNAAYP